MTTVRDVYHVLFAAAPDYMKMDWDNVGLLCGRWEAPVSRILVALDPSPEAIQEAIGQDCQLLVTHHPLIFSAPKGINAVNEDTIVGRSLLALIENHIAAINLHTNLDCAPGGVNDVLARKLGLRDVTVLNPTGTDEQGRPYGLIRMGTVDISTLPDFAVRVKQALGCAGVRFSDGNRPVRKVAVGGGSCGGAMDEVLAAGCDTFVTADLKYNQFLDAPELGLNLIDAGHFETEHPVCAHLCGILTSGVPEVTVIPSKCTVGPIKFV